MPPWAYMKEVKTRSFIPELRKRHEKNPTYKGLTWMTEEPPFNTKGLEAVAVEVDSDDDHLMDIVGRSINAGMHIDLDKPGGKSFSSACWKSVDTR